MSRKTYRIFISGMAFTFLWGIPAHFIYEWSGRNPFAGLFFPVNESVWEHMKLLFFPVLLYTFFEGAALGKFHLHFLTARSAALLAGLLVIPTLFFVYTGFLGRNFLLFDVLIYVFSIVFTFFFSRYLEIRARNLSLPAFVLLVFLLFLLILFFSFTFEPPGLPMFAVSGV